MSARILDITPSEYHRDAQAETPTLSPSIAKVLIDESPYRAWLAHPRFGNIRREETDDMRFGTVVHELVLNAGKGLAVLEFDSFRTKEAKSARDAAEKEGKTPILSCKMETAQKVAGAIVAAMQAEGVALGRCECPVEWDHNGTLCRGMMDSYRPGEILDLKIVASVHPSAIAAQFTDFGYDIQSAAYLLAAEDMNPELAGRTHIRFVFAEKVFPYEVVFVDPSAEMLHLGGLRWDKAVLMWRECLLTKKWPKYGTIKVNPKPWMVSQWMEEES